MLIYSFSGEMSVSFLDLEAAFPIVVTYSKIDGFPQITENNLGIGKIFYKQWKSKFILVSNTAIRLYLTSFDFLCEPIEDKYP